MDTTHSECLKLIVSSDTATPGYVLTTLDTAGTSSWQPATGGGSDVLAGVGIEVTGLDPKTITNTTEMTNASSPAPPGQFVGFVVDSPSSLPPTYLLKLLEAGSNVTLADNGQTVQINSGAVGPSVIECQQNGSTISASVDVLDFVGSGVYASLSTGSQVDVAIPGVAAGAGISVGGSAPSVQTITANLSFGSSGAGISLIDPSTNGSNLILKSIVGAAGISITNSPFDQVTIEATGNSGVESQNEGVTLTTDTASLDFTGVGVTATVSGDNVTVNVPGVQQGAGIIVTQSPIDGPQIIDANVSLTSAGGDISLVSSTSTNSAHVLKGLSAGSGITLENSPEGDITIHGTLLTVDNESTPLTTQAASLNFTGAGVVASAVGDDVTIHVPGVVAGDGSIIVTQSPADSAQSLVANVTLSTAPGGGISLVSATSTTSAHVTKNLVEGSGISLQNSPDGEITISATATAISVSEDGSEITPSVTSFDFTGSGVTASASGNDVTVSVPAYTSGDNIVVTSNNVINSNWTATSSGAHQDGDQLTIQEILPNCIVNMDSTGHPALPVGGIVGPLYVLGQTKTVFLPTAISMATFFNAGDTWEFSTHNPGFVTPLSSSFNTTSKNFTTALFALAFPTPDSGTWINSNPLDGLIMLERTVDRWLITIEDVSPAVVSIRRLTPIVPPLPTSVIETSPSLFTVTQVNGGAAVNVYDASTTPLNQLSVYSVSAYPETNFQYNLASPTVTNRLLLALLSSNQSCPLSIPLFCEPVFIATFNTALAGSPGNVITMPVISAPAPGVTIDWGDSSSDSGVTAFKDHTYSVGGTYTVKVRGSMVFGFGNAAANTNNRTRITSVQQWGGATLTTYSLSRCNSLVLSGSITDYPTVTANLTGCLRNNTSTANITNLGQWDMSAVTSLANFNGAGSDNTPGLTFTGNATGGDPGCEAWDVSAVTNFSYFVDLCPFNAPIGSWRPSSATTFERAFSRSTAFNGGAAAGPSNYGDLSGWGPYLTLVTTMNSAFSDGTGNAVFNCHMGNWQLTSCTQFSNMFTSQTRFKDADLSNWSFYSGPSTVNMTSMFQGCTAFTGTGLSTWGGTKLNRVNAVVSMFNGCSNFNAAIDTWQFPLVTSTQNMFLSCAKFNNGLATGPGALGDLSAWSGNFANVTTALNMFLGCTALNCSMQNWSFPACLSFVNMFSGCSNMQAADLSGWTFYSGLSSVNMQGMFSGCSKYTGTAGLGLNTWGALTRVTNMSGMFNGCTAFNGNVSGWDVSNVTTMNNMFLSCSGAFSRDLSSWNISKCTDFTNFLNTCATFNSPMNNWTFSASSAVNCINMFLQASTFNQDLSTWTNVSSITNFVQMFQYARAFDGSLANWTFSTTTPYSMNNMFNMSAITSAPFAAFTGIGLNTWTNLSQCTNMGGMFNNCRSFNADISGWNVSNVTTLSGTFFQCFVFNADLSAWNVGNVTSLANTFQSCLAFNSSLANWNVSKVTNFTGTFFTCQSFNGSVAGWTFTTSTPYVMTNMFANCTSFTGIGLDSWSLSSFSPPQRVTSFNSMFSNCTALSGMSTSPLFFGSWDIRNVTDFALMFSGVTLPTVVYDDLLIGWANQVVTYSLTTARGFNGGNSKYSISGGGTAARNTLTGAPYNWSISDGGEIP